MLRERRKLDLARNGEWSGHKEASRVQQWTLSFDNIDAAARGPSSGDFITLVRMRSQIYQ